MNLILPIKLFAYYSSFVGYSFMILKMGIIFLNYFNFTRDVDDIKGSFRLDGILVSDCNSEAVVQFACKTGLL